MSFIENDDMCVCVWDVCVIGGRDGLKMSVGTSSQRRAIVMLVVEVDEQNRK